MHNKLSEIVRFLQQEKVDFVICGGVACILQGCDRTTYDLDINIAMNEDNLRKFIHAAKQLKLIPRIPEPLENILIEQKRKSWIEEKNALVFTLLTESGDFQVDVFLVYSIPFHELFQNADQFEMDGYQVKVSSKMDLIRAKNAVFPPRDKDLYDIKQLRKILDEENR